VGKTLKSSIVINANGTLTYTVVVSTKKMRKPHTTPREEDREVLIFESFIEPDDF
jgi:uncharacterized protein YcfJ